MSHTDTPEANEPGSAETRFTCESCRSLVVIKYRLERHGSHEAPHPWTCPNCNAAHTAVLLGPIIKVSLPPAEQPG